MYVYKAERDAGIGDLIRERRPVVLACEAEPAETHVPVADIDPKGRPARALAALHDDDLFWFKSLLVSSGINDNDHFFDPVEIYAARYTPEHKPVNIDHIQHEIVGHMVGSQLVAADRVTAVADDTAPDELPPEVHLVTPGVIYRRWEDDAIQAKVDKVIAEVVDHTRAVSMECWYKSFDYCIEDAEGAMKIVARNRETAGLTRLLRFFGGPGKVDGKRIGMVLRGLTFTGKGLVTNPANKNSEILETGGAKAEAAAASGYGISPTNKELEMEKTESDLKAKVDELEQLNKTLQAQVAEATARLTELATANKTLSDELTAIKAEAARAARVEKCHAELNLPRDEAGKAKVEAFLKPLSTLSDESFESVLKIQKDLLTASRPAETAAAEAKPLAEVVTAKLLDGVKADEGLTLATQALSADALKAVIAQVSARYHTK